VAVVLSAVSSIVEDITAGYAEGFDDQRTATQGAGAKLHFLQTDGGSQRFTQQLTLTDAWAASFSDFFGTTTFKVARPDVAFSEIANRATHLVVTDSDNPALNNQLHEINREHTRPAGVKAFWKIRATTNGKRYFPNQ